jgi:alkylated DNA repair dioxygenase AlkB
MKPTREGSGITLFRCFVRLYATFVIALAVAFSETKTKPVRPRRRKSKPAPSLQVKLQSCFTPASILEDVAAFLTPQGDSSGSLSSVTLVRLSKQLISLENKRNNSYDLGAGENEKLLVINETDEQLWNKGLENAVNCLTLSNWVESEKSLEAAVEGIKAAAVISRLLPKCQGADCDGISDVWWEPLLEKLVEEDDSLADATQAHQLSGLKWSLDCFRLSTTNTNHLCQSLPLKLQHAYDELDLPFTVRPGFLTKISSTSNLSSKEDEDHGNDFTVESFVEQVDFRVETIKTTSKRVVAERRQTAWQGDDHVASFEYSGKSMERMPWSPVVTGVRDRLHKETSHYYDGCLLNLYPDGGSGMRYHIDPDQGDLWGFETVVVSIGATRRFAFRSILDGSTADGDGKKATNSKPHMFVLMDGDVTEMVRDCQERFQHTVKTAEFKGESAPRVSLVFKKTLCTKE